MSVTPSPIGGFAAQFFDNNGVILSGGKIYTYAAGTTTPQTTYTSASGATPHANPIILDSAGRVPGGEIWLTDGLVYKFVIETATGSLLGTYDNITGVNSNFVNYTVQEEVITATAGQTVFNLSTINYTPGTNSLSVYIDGVNQYVGDSYLETDSDTVTFTSGVHVGGEVKFTTAIQTTTGAVDSSIVVYDPPFTGSVATNVEAKLAQTVSVKDFGAVCDGVADDTAAVQTAIDYCLANHKDLLVDGRCLITSSLNIDKPVDDPTYDEYFTILSINNGGFRVESAIPMFSTTIPFTTAPVCALVRFQDLVFECSNSALAAYVLDDARFLRTVFTGCSFSKIKCLTAQVVYTQSIYFFECNVRRTNGIFFDSGVFTYDFKMVGCLVEAISGSALRMNNPVGCSVVSSCIEGISGTAIIYDGAQGLDVTGSYFEANGLDIDGTDGGTSSSLSYGVCLNGNYFANSTTTYTVKWGQMLSGCISIGNWHTGYMHDVTAGAAGLVTFDTAQSSLSNVPDIEIIQGGFDGQFTGVLTGVTTTVSNLVQFNKVGSTVTLKFLTTRGTSNSTGCTITGLPSYLKPLKQQSVVMRLMDNDIELFGLATISEVDGTIVFSVGAGASPFTAAGQKGITSFTITYSLT
jgi:hypothetical protein